MCRFPNVAVPLGIVKNDTRCIGRCHQTYGKQLVMAQEQSKIKFGLTNIEVKTGCSFVPDDWFTDLIQILVKEMF